MTKRDINAEFLADRERWPIDPEKEKILNLCDKDELFEKVKNSFHTNVAPIYIHGPWSKEQAKNDLEILEEAWGLFLNMKCLDGDISEKHREELLAQGQPTKIL